jgi:hypothetical protein
METEETKRHLTLDGAVKRDSSISTRDHIREWWESLENPSTYERNFYRLFDEYGQDLRNLSMQIFPPRHDVVVEAKKKNVFGRCHSVGHSRIHWSKRLKKNSTLWLGYVDVDEDGSYLKTMKHTFITWNLPNGERVIFDQVLIKAVVERLDFAFSNYYAVPIPCEFPRYVEDFLMKCGVARTALNYSVYMDNITFAADDSTDKLLAEMHRLRKKNCPG